jgi:membrane-bound lytic murein transglycosylase A
MKNTPIFDIARRICRSASLLATAFLSACVAAPALESAPVPKRVAIRSPHVYTPPTQLQPWQQLPDWQMLDLAPSWNALLQSCRVLRHKAGWKGACLRADKLARPDNEQMRRFFESEFVPRQLINRDGSSNGLVTGYYEPKLKGNYTQTPRFRYPLYAAPDDLPSSGSPYLSSPQRRYFSRAEIKAGKADLAGRELFWVENEVDLCYLQIQGSGRIELPSGELIKIGHAGHNGHPYHSVAQKLVNMGELTRDQASMWDIKDWGAQHPQQLSSLLNSNPRYVFFRELPPTATAPIGALGVPLTEGYSIAVDPHSIPMGAPVFLATTYPNSSKPLNRLVFAQDVGIAIKGKVRADFFWGFGNYAETQASRMKQSGQMWVLMPRKAARG